MSRRLLIALTLLATLATAFAPQALAQAQPQVTITAPASGAAVPGPDVTVTISVSGTTLVPAAQATRLEDLHVHYLLDVDPTPYLSGTTPIPPGDPKIVHSGALSNTFSGVAPGAHTVTVILGLSDHRAVQPPVAPRVSFTVAGTPAQLPRTGDLGNPALALIVLGVLALIIGGGMRFAVRLRR